MGCDLFRARQKLTVVFVYDLSAGVAQTLGASINGEAQPRLTSGGEAELKVPVCEGGFWRSPLIVAIHQPQYFPWPRYIHKILAADLFVYLDTVQFSKNGLQNRNQIKTATGASWLTVPVKHHFGQNLNEVEIAEPRVTHKHWKTIQANYARTRGFALWHTELEKLLSTEYPLLVDATIASTEWMLERLETKTDRVKASDLKNITGTASQLVASICREVGATKYLTGTGALAYLDQKDFAELGCEVIVQTWTHFDYEQSHPSVGFVPDLSTLDLLLNCPETANELITKAGSWIAFANK